MASVAYLFPGQGSQAVGMGQALAQQFAAARETFQEADDILGFPLTALCFNGPADTLTATQNAQPAILTASVAALRALRAARPDLPAPCCVAGHSLGEYSALVAAGALAFADALRLTRLRGQLMAAAGAAHGGSMAAVLKLADDAVAALCAQAAAESGDVVQVANYNSPGQVVISGGATGVAAATARAKSAGARVMPLAVSVAAHSALMAPAAKGMAEAVNAAAFAAPTVSVIGNVQAQPLITVDEVRAELVAQLTSPVRWTDSVNYMATQGADLFVEVGPGTVLTGLVRRINPALAVFNVAEPDHLAALPA
jgi:[acyl-carrier-protein] S-malonyltransferase